MSATVAAPGLAIGEDAVIQLRPMHQVGGEKHRVELAALGVPGDDHLPRVRLPGDRSDDEHGLRSGIVHKRSRTVARLRAAVGGARELGIVNCATTEAGVADEGDKAVAVVQELVFSKRATDALVAVGLAGSVSACDD